MDKLIFPPVDFRLKRLNEKTEIYDVLRKKEVVLTPEEWVRQHFIHHLIRDLHYPKSLMRIEDGMKVFGMQKRSDLVVYDRSGGTFLLAECKAPGVKLHQKSMEQLSVYNQHYRSPYVALTNGLVLFVCRMYYQTQQIVFIDGLPEYK